MITSRRIVPVDSLKHTSRIRKVVCIPDNYIVRVSKSTMLRYGTPICPACRNAMTESMGGNN
jgi:hypothetical protein